MLSLVKYLPLRLKINIFKASCLAILLYGSESWILTANLEKSLNSFATYCYRVMLNIKRLDKRKNEDIYKIVSQEPLAITVQQRQLRFLGHCLRKDVGELINKYVLYEPKPSHGKRSRGKPRMLYPEYVGKLISSEFPPSIS